MDRLDKSTAEEQTKDRKISEITSPINTRNSSIALSDSDRFNAKIAMVGKYFFYTLFWAVVVYSAYHYMAP